MRLFFALVRRIAGVVVGWLLLAMPGLLVVAAADDGGRHHHHRLWLSLVVGGWSWSPQTRKPQTNAKEQISRAKDER